MALTFWENQRHFPITGPQRGRFGGIQWLVSSEVDDSPLNSIGREGVGNNFSTLRLNSVPRLCISMHLVVTRRELRRTALSQIGRIRMSICSSMIPRTA